MPARNSSIWLLTLVPSTASFVCLNKLFASVALRFSLNLLWVWPDDEQVEGKQTGGSRSQKAEGKEFCATTSKII